MLVQWRKGEKLEVALLEGGLRVRELVRANEQIYIRIGPGLMLVVKP
jgi:hypothetical protein